MLDYIPPYDPKVARPLSEEDKELESDLNYSRYKDLVDHARTGGNIINNKIPIISNSQYEWLITSVVQENNVIKEVYDKIEEVILDSVAFKGGPPPQEKEEYENSVEVNYHLFIYLLFI